MELIFMTEVTCLYCKQKIYKEDENTVRVGTRYAHKECAEKGAKKKQASRKGMPVSLVTRRGLEPRAL